MYRILVQENELRERRNQLRHPEYKKPELLATRPNQVWSWDITKLLGPVKWTYFYLYVILDIFSNRSRLKPREDSTSAEAIQNEDLPGVSNSNLRRRWANLIRRVYQADPLTCPKCGAKMRVLSFITQPRVINKILEHLKNRAIQKRGPPTPKLQQAPLPLSLMCSYTLEI